MEAPRARNPQAVLFACGLNSVRSPMAESLLQQMFPQGLYVRSAGVKKGELDPFAVSVMAELGQDISSHKPQTFEELEDWEGLNFDLIITLSPEAHHKALDLTRTLAADVVILADAGSDRHQRQPRAEAGRLSRGLRWSSAAHPPPLCQGWRGKPVRHGEARGPACSDSQNRRLSPD
ncbi:protein-tyrosine-phosphatase [Bradyrhizobium elkanii]